MAHSLRSTTKTTPRASRHARPVTSYEEPASDIDEELYFAAMASDAGDSDRPLATRRPPRGRPSIISSPAKRRRQDSHSPPASGSQSLRVAIRSKRQRVTGKNTAKRGKTSPNTSPKIEPRILERDPHSAGIVPAWTSLPYQILVQIFQYAAYPLHDEFFRPTGSTDWLLKTSRICRTFAEPALTALYLSPPLVPMERAHRLRQLLMADQNPMTFKYRAKVERLQIEISQTAEYSLGLGYGRLDLYGLVYNSPRLTALELYHQKDMAPYKGLDDTIKWTYPDGMFVALASNVDGVPTKLQSWCWSSRMGGKRWPVERLEEVHQTPSFLNLRKVSFVNYQDQLPRLRKNEPDPEHEKKIAKSLSVLPDLEHLIFDSSTIVNATLLPLLPTNLKNLELINCWEVLADDMATFLLTHGSHLETLTLNHNQSLSLSFLTVLGGACPRLRSLKMNLNYYDIHSTYHDSEPLYPELLRNDEVPSWPSSLQTLELTQLRKWDVDQAKMFFESLLGSAESLPNLRSLTVKAIINTSWRERSTFRDTWVGAFDRVFKRKFTPPNPHMRSIGACENWKKQNSEVKPGKQTNDKNEEASGDIRTLRRRRHVAVLREDSESLTSSDSDEVQSHDAKTSPKLNMRRGIQFTSNEVSPSLGNSGSNRPISENSRDVKRSRTMTRELANLRKTAGKDAPKEGSSTTLDSSSEPDTPLDNNDTDSDDEPLVNRPKKAHKREVTGRAEEFIQGMCDLVLVRIDNLRPTETQFREADFLDSEPDGDADWDGNDDDDAGYAW